MKTELSVMYVKIGITGGSMQQKWVAASSAAIATPHYSNYHNYEK